MRGLGLIIGYILGNAQARQWCINMLRQTSCAIEKDFMKTELGKIFSNKQNAEVKRNKPTEKKPNRLTIGESYVQED